DIQIDAAMLHALERADGAIELLTLAHIVDGLRETARSKSRQLRRRRDTPGVEHLRENTLRRGAGQQRLRIAQGCIVENQRRVTTETGGHRIARSEERRGGEEATW